MLDSTKYFLLILSAFSINGKPKHGIPSRLEMAKLGVQLPLLSSNGSGGRTSDKMAEVTDVWPRRTPIVAAALQHLHPP